MIRNQPYNRGFKVFRRSAPPKTHPTVLLAACAILPIFFAAAPTWSDTSFLDNGVIRIGVDLDRGGAIHYLSESGSSSSVVNVYDLGRYVQQSYYSGPQPFVPDGATVNPQWIDIGWNPVQAGDSFGFPSQVLDSSNDGTTLYVKCIPKQWALRDWDSESTMEAWITLDENRAHVRCRLVNNRSDTTQYPARGQELPAVYTVGTLHRLFTYAGAAPFTDENPTEIINNGPPWDAWLGTESWSALVNDQDWGLGVFHPGALVYNGGFHGTPGVGGPLHDNTGYISPIYFGEILDHDITYEYEYTLILGDLYDDIRAYAYANAPDPRPNHVFNQDRQHCYHANLTDEGPPYAGFWPLTLDQNDPQVFGPWSLWNSADVPRVYIRAAHCTQYDQAEVYFAGSDGAFSASKRVPFTVIPDGGVHTYEVDLSSHSLYTGIITRLRFDPVVTRAPGDSVDLYSIRVIADDCDGDLDGDGDTDQSDLGVLLASYEIDGGGDLDGDGDTDQSDLGILLADYGCAP
ncbi:MAG: hypothetical protein KAS72_03580 [Phycisphaerales bacterium]|nr:hypothetical protein [Phycisphaerales bacterium]